MTTAICPGSFDPVTNRHLDIIERTAAIFDKVIVAVLENPSKEPLFTAAERRRLLQEVVAHLPNIEVEYFQGLLVDYAKKKGRKGDCQGAKGDLRF